MSANVRRPRLPVIPAAWLSFAAACRRDWVLCDFLGEPPTGFRLNPSYRGDQRNEQ
jgi:hypothetical protein